MLVTPSSRGTTLLPFPTQGSTVCVTYGSSNQVTVKVPTGDDPTGRNKPLACFSSGLVNLQLVGAICVVLAKMRLRTISP